MKTDFSKLPREEVEARITTMLMGEMPEAEAAELRAYITGDAGLMELERDLKATISLVEEVTTGANASGEKISEGRREKLLESFKVVRPAELAAPKANKRWLVEWAAVAAMIVLLLGMLLPSLAKSKSKSMRIARLNDERRRLLERQLDAREENAPSTALSSAAPVENAPAAQSYQHTLRYLDSSTAPAKAASGAVENTRIELPNLSAAAGEEVLTERQAGVGDAISLGRSLATENRQNWQVSQELRSFYEPKAPENQPTSPGLFTFGGASAAVDDKIIAGKDVVASSADERGPRGRIDPLSDRQPGVPGQSGVLRFYADTEVEKADGAQAKGKVEQPVMLGVELKPLAAGVDATTLADNEAVGAEMKKNVAEVDSLGRKETEDEAGAASGQMGGAPGTIGGMQSYMSNPELMKRYFPQMYATMQKQKAEDKSADDGPGGAVPPPMAMPMNRYSRPIPADKSESMFTSRTKEFRNERIQASTEIQDARSKIEQGDLQGAEKLLREAIAEDPKHRAASYYLDLIKEQRHSQEARNTQVAPSAREALARVDERALFDLPARPLGTTGVSGDRELETLRKLRDSIQARILQEQTDAQIPKAQAIQIINPAQAEPQKKTSMIGRLQELASGKVERSVTIDAPRDSTDTSPLLQTSQSTAYDPYFMPSEDEKLNSPTVLGKVVDDLKLNEAWGSNGRQLTREEAIARLRKNITVQQDKKTGLVEIRAQEKDATKAAQIANGVADAYLKYRQEVRGAASRRGIEALKAQLADQERLVAQKEAALKTQAADTDTVAAPKPSKPGLTPQPEVATAENAFSTFSLNVSDVSFKLAQASLEKGLMPEPMAVRSEEFINAFDYRDPAPSGAPVAFAWERARYPFAQDRDLIRMSVKTAASGREAGRPLNLVLLVDSSGSMERADRVRILRECMRTLGGQLRAEDKVSVVGFARTARLWVDGLAGSQAGELAGRVGNLAPEGGTNLEEAMRVAYETARKHFLAGGVNRVVLLTDGAANLGDVEPESLKRKVEEERRRGIALDCFGIGWEGLNDELLETLSRNGDGRYGFVNTPEAATAEFAGQLAGALNVAASDVKVQVEWNPKRVTAYRQIGYAKHQLTKEQFRDNTVDAAEIGAAEAGNALYTAQVNPAGEGPLGTVRVRFKVPGTNDYREHEWAMPYDGGAKALENSDYSLRLAGAASAFSESLAGSPFASEVTSDRLISILSGVPEHFAPDPRPKKLEWMIRQAKSLAGK